MKRIIPAALAVLLLAGCSTRTYQYIGADGRSLDIKISNSDTNIGELEVQTSDGSTVRLSQVSVESQMAEALATVASLLQQLQEGATP
jgi:hypothetical protein